MEWLLAPIDPARAHDVGFAVSWHARSMVIAWGVLAPLAVLIARYFKVVPGQDWPRELDSQVWWRSHWMGHSCVAMLSLFGLGLILQVAQGRSLHGFLGYVVLFLMLVQVSFGVMRGSKGGPTAPGHDGSLSGDHYDMSPRRVIFEYVHKCVGYLTLILSVVVIVMGLWDTNAPRWMWITLTGWWAFLIGFAIMLQARGRAVDTYQAIWGPGPEHPGNHRAPVGWGIRRLKGK